MAARDIRLVVSCPFADERLDLVHLRLMIVRLRLMATDARPAGRMVRNGHYEHDDAEKYADGIEEYLNSVTAPCLASSSSAQA